MVGKGKSELSKLLILSAGLLATTCVGATGPVADDKLRKLRTEARALEHGEGVTKDQLRASELYCKGAREGDAEAQFSLGWMYANGRGVSHSDEIASAFFQMAAGQGHEQAQKMLRFVGETRAPLPECMKKPIVEEGEPVFAPATPMQQKVFRIVRTLAPEYGISPRLVLAVILAESNFEPAAVSPKNAQGLMQLIPETSLRFNVRKPFDPEQTIRGGMAYLRWLLAYFEGSVPLVAAAYNAGEGAVNKYRGIPPFAETRDYVKRIVQIFDKQEHPFDPGVTEPSPELQRIRLARKRQG